MLELAALRCEELDPYCVPGLQPWLQRLNVLVKSGVNVSAEIKTLQEVLRLPSYIDLNLPTIPLSAQDEELEKYHDELVQLAVKLFGEGFYDRPGRKHRGAPSST